ncbi:MAG: ArnT family glycosyltransferase [Anaerolineales bacterium]
MKSNLSDPGGFKRDTRRTLRGAVSSSFQAGILTALTLIMAGTYLLLVSPIRAPAALVVLLGILRLSWTLILQRRPTAMRSGQHVMRRLKHGLHLDPCRSELLLLGTGLTIASRAAAGDGARVESILALPLWIGGILFTLLAFHRPADSRQHPPRAARVEWLALAVLTLAAFLLRAWKIESMPYVLSGDEGSAGLTGMEFLHGLRNNPLGLGWFSFPAFYFWLLSGLQLLFGRTIVAIRMLSALAGALLVPAVFWLLKGFFGRRAGWLGAIWISAFHALVFFSRVAYNNIFDSLMYTLILAALWDGFQNGRRSSYLLAGVFLGFSQYFYTTSHAIPFLLAVWILLIAIRRDHPVDLWQNLAMTAIVAVSISMPLLLLYLAHPGEIFFTASRVSMLLPGWIEPAAAALGTTPLGLVLEQIWVTALGLSAGELQGVYYGSGVPLLFGLSVPIFYLGLFICLWRIRDPRFNLPLLTLGATLLIGGLSIQAPNAQRMMLLMPMTALLIAIPLDRAADWLGQRLGPVAHAAATAASLALVCFMAFQNLSQLFGTYFPREAYGSLNGEVAMRMVDVLGDTGFEQPVFFVGGDRMSFYSIPSLPYLLPDVAGVDLEYPYEVPETVPQQDQPLLFIILPEQSSALELIHERYAPGKLSASYNRRGQLLFYLYRYDGG